MKRTYGRGSETVKGGRDDRLSFKRKSLHQRAQADRLGRVQNERARRSGRVEQRVADRRIRIRRARAAVVAPATGSVRVRHAQRALRAGQGVGRVRRQAVVANVLVTHAVHDLARRKNRRDDVPAERAARGRLRAAETTSARAAVPGAGVREVAATVTTNADRLTAREGEEGVGASHRRRGARVVGARTVLVADRAADAEVARQVGTDDVRAARKAGRAGVVRRGVAVGGQANLVSVRRTTEAAEIHLRDRAHAELDALAGVRIRTGEKRWVAVRRVGRRVAIIVAIGTIAEIQADALVDVNVAEEALDTGIAVRAANHRAGRLQRFDVGNARLGELAEAAELVSATELIDADARRAALLDEARIDAETRRAVFVHSAVGVRRARPHAGLNRAGQAHVLGQDVPRHAQQAGLAVVLHERGRVRTERRGAGEAFFTNDHRDADRDVHAVGDDRAVAKNGRPDHRATFGDRGDQTRLADRRHRWAARLPSDAVGDRCRRTIVESAGHGELTRFRKRQREVIRRNGNGRQHPLRVGGNGHRHGVRQAADIGGDNRTAGREGGHHTLDADHRDRRRVGLPGDGVRDGAGRAVVEGSGDGQLAGLLRSDGEVIRGDRDARQIPSIVVVVVRWGFFVVAAPTEGQRAGQGECHAVQPNKLHTCL